MAEPSTQLKEEPWVFGGTKRVVSAAIRKDETGEVIMGVRHFCPVMREQMQKFPEGYWRGGCTQGFITNEMIVEPQEDGESIRYYRFLNRKEAYILAEEQGQIFREEGGPVGTLYSEHLY